MGGWFEPDSGYAFSSHTGFARGVGSPVGPSVLPSITPDMFLAFFANDANMSVQAPLAIQMQIDISAPVFNVARWGDKYNLGQLYYVAHQLILQKITSQNPIVDVKVTAKVGNVSKGSSADLIKAQNANPLLRTVYGQEFMRYRDMVAVGAVAV